MGNIADNLITLRKQKGFSQDELAQKIGISRQAVSNWERGVSTPDVETLKLLAQALEADFNTVLTGEAPRKAKMPENRVASLKNRRILLLLNLAVFAGHLALTLYKHRNLQALVIPGFFVSFALFVYFLFRHIITQNNYSILAGYDPKQDDPELVKKQMETIDLFNLLFAFVYSSFCFLSYVSHIRALLLVIHIVSFTSAVLVVNLKQKSG